MIIDFHTHCFPDKLAPKAIAQLEHIIHWTPFTDGTYGDLRKKMSEWGVDRAICLNVATNAKQQFNVNNFAASINDQVHTCAFGSVHPDSENMMEEFARIRTLGMQGIKLHPDYQGFEIDDPKLFELYDACSQTGTFCVYHSGWDPVSPDYTRVTPQKVMRVHELFPKFKMVLGHLGGFASWDDVYEIICGHGILMDTALIAGLLPVPLFVNIVNKNGAENIVFGSDCPWQRSIDTAKYIDAAPISSAQKDRIFYQNALELLNWKETE